MSNDRDRGLHDEEQLLAQRQRDSKAETERLVAEAAETTERLRVFLEAYPLHRAQEVTIKLVSGFALLEFPDAISMPCHECKDEPITTWEHLEDDSRVAVGVYLQYRCVHCRVSVAAYWVNVEEVRVAPKKVAKEPPPPPFMIPSGFAFRSLKKIGQSPAWSISPPREVTSALKPDEAALYRKGLANLSQGYGLGALAYFRRVIEMKTTALLELIEEAAKLEGNEAALVGIEAARRKREAEERLRLAAELLPQSLRPAGKNPLEAMYGLFSAGVHGSLTEEESLEVAQELRDSLDYIFIKMRRDLQEAKAYERSIAKAAELSAKVKARKPGEGTK